MSVQKFIAYLQIEKNYSPHTCKAYVRDLTAFQNFLQGVLCTDTAIGAAHYSEIRSWIVALSEQGVSNRTINRKISALGSYYKFLMHIGENKKTPLLHHKPLKTSKKISVPFTRDEMEVLFSSAFLGDDYQSILQKTMLLLFYETGMRRSELIRLQCEQVNIDSATLRVLGKGNKEREIPLLSGMVAQLGHYQTARDHLVSRTDTSYFFLSKKGKRLSETFVYKSVTHALRMVSSKAKISPHMLRHTFATHLLDQGAAINTVKALLGHESLAATQLYTHSSISQIQDKYNAAHPRAKTIS